MSLVILSATAVLGASVTSQTHPPHGQEMLFAAALLAADVYLESTRREDKSAMILAALPAWIHLTWQGEKKPSRGARQTDDATASSARVYLMAPLFWLGSTEGCVLE